MVTKDWTTNVGLAGLPNTAHKQIAQEQVGTFKKKMHTVF